jgi:hypothetical protein
MLGQSQDARLVGVLERDALLVCARAVARAGSRAKWAVNHDQTSGTQYIAALNERVRLVSFVERPRGEGNSGSDS